MKLQKKVTKKNKVYRYTRYVLIHHFRLGNVIFNEPKSGSWEVGGQGGHLPTQYSEKL